MRLKPILTSAVLAVLFILQSGAAVSAQRYDLSPGLEILSEGISMSKHTVMTKELRFSREDFEQTFGCPLESVTVTRLPSADIGVLKYAGSEVYEGQTVPCTNLGLLKFTPSRNVGSTSFTVYADDADELFVSCNITVTEKHNSAPTAGSVSANPISGIGYMGNLDIYDPDGDVLSVEISAYPENGVVKLGESGFVYTSMPGFSGKDSFTYTVCDKYGNVSECASVTLNVSKPVTDVRYDDMTGHWGYTGALKMTELGLMSGSEIDGTTVFDPDASVTRGDFLAMAMICAGLESEIEPGAVTTFADDTSIPHNIRSYASYAEAGGIISGYRNADGRAVFASGDEITRAEAVTVLANLIGDTDKAGDFDYTDAASVPEWARADFASLTSLGIINGDPNGMLRPGTTLTRAEAAQMLCNMRELL